MTHPSIPVPSASAKSGPRASDPPQLAGAVLDELESSLRCSQRALLEHDLPGLEEATRDQMRLRRMLEVLEGEIGCGHRPEKMLAEGMPAAPDRAGLDAAVRATRARVLHLARVQAAILAREQRWLRALASLAAGPEAVYRSPRRPDCCRLG